MAVEDFDHFLRQLRDHPEWREELRRVVLTDELLALPDRVAQLAEAQRRTEEQLQALAEQVRALGQRLDSLIEQISEMAGHVEWLKGDAIQRRYRERAAAYFGRIARRIHTLTQDELEDMLERSVEEGKLTEQGAQELRLSDAVIRARRHEGEVFLVVEASWGVGLDDARRAQEGSELLARTGVTALGVVAGTWITPDVRRAAPAMGLWQVEDGRVTPPEGTSS